MPVIIGELLAILGPWITRFFIAKGVLMVGWFLARVGLALATNEYVMQPLVEHIVSFYSGMPAEFQCWFRTVGINEALSICLSGLTLIAAKKIFFTKAGEA